MTLLAFTIVLNCCLHPLGIWQTRQALEARARNLPALAVHEADATVEAAQGSIPQQADTVYFGTQPPSLSSYPWGEEIKERAHQCCHNLQSTRIFITRDPIGEGLQYTLQ